MLLLITSTSDKSVTLTLTNHAEGVYTLGTTMFPNMHWDVGKCVHKHSSHGNAILPISVETLTTLALLRQCNLISTLAFGCS